MEVDESGRASKLNGGGGGLTRASVWETRMRIDQVKGGIKVFGVFDQEEGGVEQRGGKTQNDYDQKHEEEEEEEEERGVIAGKNAIPLRRIGVRGGRRRTWQPQPEAFEGPLQVFGGTPDGIQCIPPKLRSESNGSPQGKDSADLRKGKLEFLQKAAQKIGNGVVSGEPVEVSENGPAEKVIVMHSRKKLTAKSPHDRPKYKKPPTHHVDQFKVGPRVSGRNDDEQEEEEEFFDIKEISVAEQKPKTPVLEENKVTGSLFRDKPAKPISAPVIKQRPSHSPVSKRSTVEQGFVKEPSYECEHDPKGQKNRVHSLADLIMWRDVPKSAFVFAFGTLIIISSYMNDPTMCFISTISYLGLACLSVIYLYRSIIWSGYVDIDNTTFHELGEEEVLCLTKILLPYLNGFLRNLRALLSGDPATTMKLSVLLFVLARCGSFVTMWNMIRLGFFTAFTIPKLWSLYTTRLTNRGKYWIELSRDSWEACPHKKAVVAVVIILILGFSSNFARIWTGFVLVVAFRYYQQALVRDGYFKSDGGDEKSERQGQHSIHSFAKETKGC